MNFERIGRIEKLVSQKESNLMHLQFDAHRGRLVATNGRALMVCECAPEPGDVSGLISVEAILCYREFRKTNKIPNMVKFRAYAEELVVEDLTVGKKFSFKRPTGAFPHYAQLMPEIDEGTPPSVSFDPALLKQIAYAFPTDELGVEVKSVSLWLLAQHQGNLKKDEQNRAPIILKAHHAGGLAMMMPVRYCLDESEWHTRIPSAIQPQPEVPENAPSQEPQLPTSYEVHVARPMDGEDESEPHVA